MKNDIKGSETTPIIPNNIFAKVLAVAFATAGGAVIGIFVFIPLGLLLCATFIGMIIGVPMVMTGVLAPFSGFYILKMREAPCPVCGHKITVTGKKGFKCKDCKQRLIINNERLIRVDDLLKS